MGAAVSAHQTAAVHVRGHDFTVDFLPVTDKLPTLIRLWLPEYPDDVLQIIDDDTLLLIRAAAKQRHAENEQYIAHAIELEEVQS